MLLSLVIPLLCHVFVIGQPARIVDERKKWDAESINSITREDIFQGQKPLVEGGIDVAHSPLLRVLDRTGEHIVIDGHNASLGKYLWSGRTGEYYEVPGGWPGWKGDVVAKEFYIWYWPHELTREVKYLSRIGQLVTHADFDGVHWLIMDKPPGVHLTKTRAFKEAYQKGRRECDDLVEGVYEPAFNAIIDLIRKYGIFHHVLNSRMLWDDDAKNVHLFDFGDDTERDPGTADDPNVRNGVALDVYTAWPNNGISYQDWCVNGQEQ